MSRPRSRFASSAASPEGQTGLERAQRRTAMNGSRDACLALARDPRLTPQAVTLLAERRDPLVTRLLVRHPVVTLDIAHALIRHDLVDGLALRELVDRFGIVPASPRVALRPVGAGLPRPASPLHEPMGQSVQGGDPDDSLDADEEARRAFIEASEGEGQDDGDRHGAFSDEASWVDEGDVDADDIGDRDDARWDDETLYRLVDEVPFDDEDDGFDVAMAAPSPDERVDRLLARIFATDVDHPSFRRLRARLVGGSPIGRLACSFQALIRDGYDEAAILAAFDLRNEWNEYFCQTKHTHLTWRTAIRLVDISSSSNLGAWDVIEKIRRRFNRGGDGESRTLGHYLARVVDDYHTSMLRGGHMPLDSLLG